MISLNGRNELPRSYIICSQHELKAWPSMLLEDEVSSNSMLKRVTRHYSVMLERKRQIHSWPPATLGGHSTALGRATGRCKPRYC